MQQKDFEPRLRDVIALAVLICLTGCITVTRETEPTPTVTTTETRSSTIVPAAATTVEGPSINECQVRWSPSAGIEENREREI